MLKIIYRRRVLGVCIASSLAVAILLEGERRRRGLSSWYQLVSGEDRTHAVLRAVFGKERLGLLSDISDALSTLTTSLESSIQPDDLRYPLLLNAGLLGLIQEDKKPTKRQKISDQDWKVKARRNLLLAASAYGALMCTGLGIMPPPQSSTKAAASLEEKDVDLALFAMCNQGQDCFIACEAGIPTHFVLRDKTQEDCLCLVIRGTRSFDDAASDLAAKAVAAIEFGHDASRVHAGILAAAKRVLDGPAGKLLLATNEKKLIISGHSLGAAVATLVAIELAILRPSTKIECFAFAPPPSSNLQKIPTNCSISVFVHGFDCVPSLSVSSVAQLLIDLARIDALPLDLLTRLRILSHYDASALYSALKSLDHNDPSVHFRKNGLPTAAEDLHRLYVVGSQAFHLHDDGTFSEFDYHRSTFPSIRIHSRMVIDHFPSAYLAALDR